MEKDQISMQKFLTKIIYQMSPFNTMVNIEGEKKLYKT